VLLLLLKLRVIICSLVVIVRIATRCFEGRIVVGFVSHGSILSLREKRFLRLSSVSYVGQTKDTLLPVPSLEQLFCPPAWGLDSRISVDRIPSQRGIANQVVTVHLCYSTCRDILPRSDTMRCDAPPWAAGNRAGSRTVLRDKERASPVAARVRGNTQKGVAPSLVCLRTCPLHQEPALARLHTRTTISNGNN
jgi:hypothetical protein